ncbi:ATP-binding protein [Achromobacter kerstersii]|uniref:ORC1/DEAH AAA+ ATPase domain-containing protein n=1 Tax=Achromobacter kerstersii TaxID=1353890 RepID=A0A6S6ZDU9_9BURK|nr:ATP-binding protein [Achromobacter kerstersii]CAB3662928.1 hypothetical protein LMG3441_00656 [Achromobacter kerstersii]
MEENDRDRFLNPGPDRDKALLGHPILTGNGQIPTAPIRAAYEDVVDALVQRKPGMCYHGDFRVGKSCAISLLTKILPQSFPKLPIRTIVAKNHEKSTEKALFSDLLFDLMHAVHEKGTAPEKRIRLLNHLGALSQDAGSGQLLLFIDEAQNYWMSDLTRLRDIVNDMERRDIYLTIVFFGDQHLCNMKSALLSAGRRDIVGRFFLQTKEFSALCTADEAEDVLSAYDDHSIASFPMSTDISYSEFFQAKAFSGGWRLREEARYCWNSFADIARCRPDELKVGMQWLTAAIRHFLFRWNPKEITNAAGHEELWRVAVMHSGFDDAFGLGR